MKISFKKSEDGEMVTQLIVDKKISDFSYVSLVEYLVSGNTLEDTEIEGYSEDEAKIIFELVGKLSSTFQEDTTVEDLS